MNTYKILVNWEETKRFESQSDETALAFFKEFSKPFPKSRVGLFKVNGEQQIHVRTIEPKKEYKVDRSKKYSEKIVENHLKTVVEGVGGMIFKNHPITNRGLPDRIIHHGGMTFYVETKATGEECSDAQKEMHKRLKNRGGIDTYVLDTKIKNYWDLFVVAYTTYPGKHYHKNPFKNET